MKTFSTFCALLALCFLSACASKLGDMAHAPGTEECHVCRYNNDLACVCVKVDATTPREVYLGTTNYFCSEDCRTAFVKNRPSICRNDAGHFQRLQHLSRPDMSRRMNELFAAAQKEASLGLVLNA
jgi:YHS domain-containing protein